MSDKVLEIAIYNENCTLSGRQAFEPRNYAGDNWPHDDCDVTVYTGTPRELLRLSVQLRKSAFAGRHNSFDFHLSRTLRAFARENW